jgi:hypothetical protein
MNISIINETYYINIKTFYLLQIKIININNNNNNNNRWVLLKVQNN